MPINSDTEERNPAHPKALTLSELTIGRRIVVINEDSFGTPEVFTVKSAPMAQSAMLDQFEQGTAEFMREGMTLLANELMIRLELEGVAADPDPDDFDLLLEFHALSDLGVTRPSYGNDPEWSEHYTLDAADAD